MNLANGQYHWIWRYKPDSHKIWLYSLKILAHKKKKFREILNHSYNVRQTASANTEYRVGKSFWSRKKKRKQCIYNLILLSVHITEMWLDTLK